MLPIWQERGLDKHAIALERKKTRSATIYLVVKAMLEFIGDSSTIGAENALVLAGYENFQEKSKK